MHAGDNPACIFRLKFVGKFFRPLVWSFLANPSDTSYTPKHNSKRLWPSHWRLRISLERRNFQDWNCYKSTETFRKEYRGNFKSATAPSGSFGSYRFASHQWIGRLSETRQGTMDPPYFISITFIFISFWNRRLGGIHPTHRERLGSWSGPVSDRCGQHGIQWIFLQRHPLLLLSGLPTLFWKPTNTKDRVGVNLEVWNYIIDFKAIINQICNF